MERCRHVYTGHIRSKENLRCRDKYHKNQASGAPPGDGGQLGGHEDRGEGAFEHVCVH
jgi:hypothetical protein